MRDLLLVVVEVSVEVFPLVSVCVFEVDAWADMVLVVMVLTGGCWGGWVGCVATGVWLEVEASSLGGVVAWGGVVVLATVLL